MECVCYENRGKIINFGNESRLRRWLFKNFIYAMGGGAAGGAAVGAAICAPTVVDSPVCSALGAIYGAVAGGFTAGLDSKK